MVRRSADQRVSATAGGGALRAAGAAAEATRSTGHCLVSMLSPFAKAVPKSDAGRSSSASSVAAPGSPAAAGC
ncbi:hypothetical protein C5C55_15715 [Rathayibacter sp. AY1C2]|uniref:hypothetical protein n=1 Tax=unclassified Rathayibacter TaxID=2609250 RepID=UPI000CE720EE|nr:MULTISPECIES: hypothetical protein [unclassified Rathayibacter]PPF52309.1 hypothetical protein C5C55_15715 [Rathayibacter sp. AY1C2]PPG56827.1 hypothetical protein C5C69_15495 [Rathayibacter sp. AY1C7]